jgi:hypothetical protein
MGRWVIALAAIGMGLVAAAAWGQVDQAVLGPTVYASHNLPSDAITGFNVTCPPGYFAVSAGVSNPGSGSTQLSVRPLRLRGFTFRFGNPATNDATRATVAVACRKSSSGAVLKVRPVKTRVVVKPGQMRSGTLACPAQTLPAGAAFDLDPGRAKSLDSFAGAALSVRTSTASPRAFRFRIANAGARAHDALLQGNCATVLTVEPAQLRTRISTYTNEITAGSHHIVHRCPAGWTALGAGYALTSGSVRIDGAAAIGAKGSWWARNTATSPVTAQLQVICARLR